MGFDMIEDIEKVNQAHDLELAMRIGLHTGSVTAGVTGTNIVRYDIYGPDVTVANLMESEGEAGRVNISESSKNILEQN